MGCAVLFGGAGFVGATFARFLLDHRFVGQVYLIDFEVSKRKGSRILRPMLDSSANIKVVIADVRQPIDWTPNEPVELVANFAAVHREPGHEDFEYYETNLLGAENICVWAERVGCNHLIFSSSISPYGPSEVVKDENSLPAPVTAYGGSKLVAEKVHQIWQAKDDINRRLVIVRPGVVFGPGEGGNVSRLIRAVLHRYFFYMGNRNTRKAGVYVKELCHAVLWVLQQQEEKAEHVSLFNMSMNPSPSIEEYVEAICKVAEVKRFILAVPYPLMLVAAYVIDFIAKPLGIRHPFSPVRIRKLVRSNNIVPTYLAENGYPYQYTLESALADWRQSCPEEWQ
ncbi:MAG: NAD(P)-dependent oxidoreductase [Gammaproteobacteria bacterium]|nr:MAG: NAD(P)-dependent oxidoreductase [Gammaproteobacteria bacterium]